MAEHKMVHNVEQKCCCNKSWDSSNYRGQVHRIILFGKLIVVGQTCCCGECWNTSKPEEGVKKVIRSNNSEKSFEEIRKEVQTLRKVQHPLLAKYSDSFRIEEQWFVVMDPVDGVRLDQYLNDKKKNDQILSEDEAMRLFIQILIALDALHSQNVYHRALTPKHVVLNEAATVLRLSDFGVGFEPTGKNLTEMTSYIPPELFKDERYELRSDMWSAGCILFEMVTLRKAFEFQNLYNTAISIENGKVAELGGAVSANMTVLIKRLLQVDTSRRPTTKTLLLDPFVSPYYVMACEALETV